MGNNPINKIDPDGGSTVPPDRYKLGEDGRVHYVDAKGGDLVDYLVVGEKEITVTDTSILPNLMNNTVWQNTNLNISKPVYKEGTYALSKNIREMTRLYEAIATHSTDEWTFIEAYTENGRMALLGSLYSNVVGLTVRRLEGGFGNFRTIHYSHSHHGVRQYDFRASRPDKTNALNHRQGSPKARFTIFSPLYTKLNYNNVFKNKVVAHTIPPQNYPLLKRNPKTKYIDF